MGVFDSLPRMTAPGLFVTGTDTGVGKTVVSCLIADQLRRREAEESPRSRIGVMKPIATGCRRDREGLVSEDAEELAFAAEFDPDVGDLTVVNPIRFKAPTAPVAAVDHPRERGSGGWTPLFTEELARSMARIDAACSHVVMEGIGGVMVPLGVEAEAARNNPRPSTVIDLMRAVGYPVVVVCRADLGTLNHTAMTCELIRRAGLTLAGLVVNGFDADSQDPAMQSNLRWLAWQNHTGILAVLPAWRREDGSERWKWDVRRIAPTLREAIDATDFGGLCRPARAAKRRQGGG
ncbi:MAG: dethiobiotin synthase [Planctomycetota bacterium]|nr:dethiobiotin synthase [Planctomycetota bacterium]